jgi:diadenylate cyclase
MSLEVLQNHWRSAFEIFVLSLVIYFILRFIRGTRGARVLLGLVLFLLLLTVITRAFDLLAIEWLLGHFFAFIVIATVVIFQPELRRALAEIGSQPLFFTISHEKAVVDTLVKVASSFSARRIGAILAIEREIGLRAIAEQGAILDGKLSPEILDQIFYPNSPLHDGGVVIQNDRVLAAACIFPLTQRTDLAKSTGTRHRAALGLSEDTDAVVMVVSEETGNISLACQGELYQNLDRERLRTLLTSLLVGSPRSSWLHRLQSRFTKSDSPTPWFEPDFKTWLLHNFGLKVFSVILAGLSWWLISTTLSAYPTRESPPTYLPDQPPPPSTAAEPWTPTP